MKHNVGSYDAAARFVGGLLIMLWGVHDKSWWGAIGLLPLITSICAFCPLYVPFGWDTTSADNHPAR